MFKIKNTFITICESLQKNISLHKIIRIALAFIIIVSSFLLIVRANDVTTSVLQSKNPIETLFEEPLEAEDSLNDVKTLSKDTEHLVNINTAPKEELMKLPNIGAKKAEEIIATRNDAPFDDITDLMQVKGIGEKTFEQLEDLICTT